MHALALAVLMAARFSSARCGGIAFTLPDGWTARATAACGVEVRPPQWSAKVKASRWEMADAPLTLVVFAPDVTLEQALEVQHFDRYSGVRPFRLGQYFGPSAFQGSRIRLRRGARPRNDDEPAGILQDVEHYVLQGEGGRVIAFDCPGGSPDEPFDCQAAVREILTTLRLESTQFDSETCGVAFTLPGGWTARVTEECDVEVRPPGWSAKAKKSRWKVADPPLKLITFEPGTTFDAALEAQEPYAIGEYSGRKALLFSRLRRPRHRRHAAPSIGYSPAL